MKLRIAGDKLTIACAHMLTKHDKCARIHGHNYLFEIEVEGELNEKHMIVDFGEFKAKVGGILKKLDHRVLLPQKSKKITIETKKEEIIVSTIEDKRYRFPKQDVVLLPIESTTVEMLSSHVHSLIKKEYPHLKITVHMSETPTSTAIYTEE